ncbi:peptidase S24 [Elizabethkingia anophelis]|nr:peptidase S24 [Elizabethkingia anophelis]
METIFTNIKERILQYTDYKGFAKEKFFDDLGVTYGNFKGKAKEKALSSDVLAKIVTTYPEINPEWLLTGTGKMLKANNIYEIDKTLHIPKTAEPMSHYGNTIPLYDLEPTASVLEIFSENPLSVPIDHISIPNLPKCDGAMHIRGDSMYPLLKSGDIVAYKTVHDYQNIIWGEMYIVYLFHNGEEYFFCKFLKKSSKEGYVDFISHNQHHQTVTFPLESIQALAIIKASIRFNTLL